MVECGPDCEETLRQIETYLDGETDALQAAQVSAHLSDCDPCLDHAEFRTHLKALIHERCAEAEPAGLRDKILQAIDRHETGPTAGA